MRCPSASHARRGFTLIELTISAGLMVIVIGSAYACLSAGWSAQRLMDPRLEAVQGARVALGLLTADLRAACPLSRDTEFIGMKRTVAGVEVGNVDFGTHNHTPARPGEGDFCQTSYYVDVDSASGELVLWRRRNPRLGVDPFSGGSREEIVRGVRQLSLEFYDGYEWYDNWGDPNGRSRDKARASSAPASASASASNLSGMPEAVRITLALAPGWRPAGISGPGSAEPDRSGERANEEPPLVFQTVARLNLAGSGAGAASSGAVEGGEGPGGAGGNPQTPAAFPGGGG